MPEFNLDQYKKTWQEQPIEQKYSNAEIVKMLNKKSTNYIKYIVWISILEFALILSLSIYYLFNDDSSKDYYKILEKMGIKNNAEVVMNFEHLYFAMKIFVLIITAIFVGCFLFNYLKIRVESNLKKFILQIVKFKKTVNLFIFTNIILLVLYFVALAFFVFTTLETQNVDLPKETGIGLLVGLIVTTIFCVVLIWLYYRLVYGIIMKRLGAHLKQLKEIEEAE
ncbi:beta-carotene 15,15'-monooxygenase [Frigoriflavimonas asaccharolytica]|uniref:Beta-carotene 15,15'-monooxygenase n=1 Tax=Frigoriflavimonas asaccharolytica TaxID=2735899 RepID=A0A8J8G8E5_9FLAO|nr:beta-carotene 15,15'-monooxygenase [Frigoriflavimonas asaccharolytica]NRS93328.1 hypothetical protein [Frigoriflavimonas asaccharolytica]